MKPKLHQTIEKGTGECPDCGWKQAAYKIIRNHDPDGNLIKDLYYLVIDCKLCDYYQFTAEEGEP